MEEVVLNKRVHKCAVKSLRVDSILGNVPNYLHHEMLVALCDYAHLTYGLLTFFGWQVPLRFCYIFDVF